VSVLIIAEVQLKVPCAWNSEHLANLKPEALHCQRTLQCHALLVDNPLALVSKCHLLLLLLALLPLLMVLVVQVMQLLLQMPPDQCHNVYCQ